MENNIFDFSTKIDTIFDQLEGYIPPQDEEMESHNSIGCPKCLNGYIFVDGGMQYCDCYIEHQLKVRYKNAGIPSEYFDYKSLEISDLKALKLRYGQDIKEGKRVNAKQTMENFYNNADKILDGGWNLILEGPTGTGKTTAASIIAMNLIQKKFSVLFIQVEQLRKSFLLENEELKQKLESVDFLILDDIGAEYLSERSDFYITQLDNLLRVRSGNKKVTIYTTNLKSSNMEIRYGSRIASLMKKDTVHILMYVEEDIRSGTVMPDFL